MPRGDKTGPYGEGPSTGRGLGFCTGHKTPGYNKPRTRLGLRRGFRGGREKLHRRRPPTLRRPPQLNERDLYSTREVYPKTEEEKKEILKEEKEIIEKEIQELKKELEEIDKRITDQE